MRVYLDMCSLQRPLDNKSQPRIAIEAEAVLNILRLCDQEELELVSSDVLDFEISKNPYPVRKAHAIASLEKARIFISAGDEIENHASELVAEGLKPLDALHMSCA